MIGNRCWESVRWTVAMADIRYLSTRGRSPTIDFEDALLTGLAPDGGLYMPTRWPRFSDAEIAALAGRPYDDIALAIIRPFVGSSIPDDALAEMIASAHATFDHPARAPIRQIGCNLFLLELFHGPTLAFKDFALQLVARLFDHALRRRDERIVIVGATSGDTGSAAIEAFSGAERAELFILYPHGRVSEVQRRQMTTPDSPNIHAFAIDGDFDDCQALVKAMFADHDFRSEVHLSGINSINWARIVAQIVYYFAAATALGAPHRSVAFTVPTGNFGDIFAGWAARRMGLPISRLIIATNRNDILHRTLDSGLYSPQCVQATSSPSMDIQVSSNFERALFEACERDANEVTKLMGRIPDGGFAIPAAPLARLRGDFASGRSSETDAIAAMTRIHDHCGEIICPHTAVGLAVAEQVRQENEPMVVLATAHAAKFPDAVHRACSVAPPTPQRIDEQATRPERMVRLPNDLQSVKAAIHERMTI